MRPVAASIGVSFRYGVRYSNGTIHKGIDYSDGREGHPVTSCLNGTVTHAGYGGWGPAYGQHVIIKSTWNGKPLWMLYGHLKTETVKVGQKIVAGQKIGTVGGRAGQRYSGNSTGPHVHVQACTANRYTAYVNPQPMIDWKPAPTKPAGIPADPKRIGKWMQINHGAATVAMFKPGALAKWLLRRKRVVIIARDKNPDVLGGIECGGGDAWHYINTKYKSFGQVLVINAGGRALWRNSATTEATIEKGILKPKAYQGDVKEVPWFVGPVNGAMMLTGLAHLDSDAPAAFNADRADEILDFLESKATKHKLGKSQIVLMIDMADKTGTVRKRIVDRGYGSAFTEAKKTDNADLSSNTYFKKPVKGYSGDDIFVWVGDGKTSKGPDAPRPVPVASKTVPAKIGDLDHLPLAAVLERQ